jgi:acetyl coenzyme A synthetase (ADP forming)-like protein
MVEEMVINQLNINKLSFFFKPRTVAVIGASPTPGKIGYEIFRNLSQYGFKGKVYPINPKANEILGVKCYSSILDTPDEVDLAVIAVPSEVVPKLIEECGQKGVKACIIVSGGFKEMGEKYKKLEEEIVTIAKKYGIRIIGPNCIGVYDSETKIDTFFQSHERMLRPPQGPISFITQSGTFCCTMLEWLAESGLGVSKFVSYGNRCDVDEADLIQYLGEDSNTKVIAMYVEGFGNGRRFLEVAKNVIRRKPIVVLKAGRTELGAKSALSHTGNLAGSYAICEAALRQVGIIIAQNLEELFDMTKALTLQPPAKGKRIAMITNGAGPCVMAVDECVKRRIELATYTQESIEGLKNTLPRFCIVDNPLDLTGSATSNEYKVSMEILLKDPNIDLLMLFFVFQDTPLDENIVSIVPEMQKYGKPIICCASGGPYTRKQSKILEEKGVPVYPTPERAVAAAHALIIRGTYLSSRLEK